MAILAIPVIPVIPVIPGIWGRRHLRSIGFGFLGIAWLCGGHAQLSNGLLGALKFQMSAENQLLEKQCFPIPVILVIPMIPAIPVIPAILESPKKN